METVALPLLQKSPFGQVLYRKQQTGGGRFYYGKKLNNRDRNNAEYGGKKTTNGAVVSQVSKVLDQKLAPLSRKFPELIPEESLTKNHPLVKNLFAGKIPNL